jgi:hypothetical protein
MIFQYFYEKRIEMLKLKVISENRKYKQIKELEI